MRTALVCLLASQSLPAYAACPIELATYRDRDNTVALEFRPRDGGATVTNSFRMLLGDDVALDGIVMWSEGIERPNGVLTYRCPDGDVTGPEYEACTVWQGVIYAVDAVGEIGLLPKTGDPAPQTLLFADLAYAVHAFPAFTAGAVKLSSDVLMLSGCQE